LTQTTDTTKTRQAVYAIDKQNIHVIFMDFQLASYKNQHEMLSIIRIRLTYIGFL